MHKILIYLHIIYLLTKCHENVIVADISHLCCCIASCVVWTPRCHGPYWNTEYGKIVWGLFTGLSSFDRRLYAGTLVWGLEMTLLINVGGALIAGSLGGGVNDDVTTTITILLYIILLLQIGQQSLSSLSFFIWIYLSAWSWFALKLMGLSQLYKVLWVWNVYGDVLCYLCGIHDLDGC